MTMNGESTGTGRIRWMVLWCGLVACTSEPSAPNAAVAGVAPAPRDTRVGYELRRLRPRDGEVIEDLFERQRLAAIADGKRVMVLFGADWCQPCRDLETELGNRHPDEQIGDVRILELKEEDWSVATRMAEFDRLRRRWSSSTGSYPLLLLLDEAGGLREEMKQAISRLEASGEPPTLANWIANTRPQAGV